MRFSVHYLKWKGEHFKQQQTKGKKSRLKKLKHFLNFQKFFRMHQIYNTEDSEANQFYDRNHQLYDTALLTRCYAQHSLCPFIDSETNHKRHFIKNPFINKRIEFIDLPRIFKDRSVTSSIPTYFQNSEPSIIMKHYI